MSHEHKPVTEAALKRVLVVDDEADLRSVLRITLADPEIGILEARDGNQALALARETLPDLIILDWMLPGMSGIEVARMLASTPETRSIPVIMLTARDGAEDEARCWAAGVRAYLTKPFSPLELLKTVERALCPAPA